MALEPDVALMFVMTSETSHSLVTVYTSINLIIQY
jgi:hypothetical protein